MAVNQSSLLFSKIIHELGGNRALDMPVRSEVELAASAERGVKKSALESIASQLDLSVPQLVSILKIPSRSLREKKDNLLSPAASAHLMKLAELVARGKEVFGKEERLKAYLQSPIPALEGKKPVELLGSVMGIQLILDEFIRIEHGVYY